MNKMVESTILQKKSILQSKGFNNARYRHVEHLRGIIERNVPGMIRITIVVHLGESLEKSADTPPVP